MSTLTTSPEKIGVRIFNKSQKSQVLDASPFTLESVPLDDSTKLVFTPPLVLTPEVTECKQYLQIEHPELGIDAIALTREELAAIVRHLWKFCAKEPDEKLGHLLIKTKRNLLKALKEVPLDRS